jgi:hypothetical protein
MPKWQRKWVSLVTVGAARKRKLLEEMIKTDRAKRQQTIVLNGRGELDLNHEEQKPTERLKPPRLVATRKKP